MGQEFLQRPGKKFTNKRSLDSWLAGIIFKEGALHWIKIFLILPIHCSESSKWPSDLIAGHFSGPTFAEPRPRSTPYFTCRAAANLAGVTGACPRWWPPSLSLLCRSSLCRSYSADLTLQILTVLTLQIYKISLLCTCCCSVLLSVLCQKLGPVHKWSSVVSYAPLSVRTLDLICFLCKPSAQPLDLMVQVLHFLFTLQVSIIANLPICNWCAGTYDLPPVFVQGLSSLR